MNQDQDLFDFADYYSANEDQEQLTCEDWGEAIREALEHGDEPLQEVAPLTIFAWRRMTISPRGRKGWAEDIVERMEDMLAESGLSDPDGDSSDLSKADRAMLETEALALVDSFFAKVVVWGCEKCASREFSAAELLAWVKENEPDWLSEGGAP